MEQLRQLAKVNFPPNYFQGRAPEEMITCALVELKEGAVLLPVNTDQTHLFCNGTASFRRTKVMGSLFFCVLAGVFSVVLVWSSYDVSKKGTELSRVRMSADVMVYPYETELSESPAQPLLPRHESPLPPYSRSFSKGRSASPAARHG